MFINVKNEFNNYCDSIAFQLGFLRKIGFKQEITLVIPNHRREDVPDLCAAVIYAELPPDNYGRHDNEALKRFLLDIL